MVSTKTDLHQIALTAVLQGVFPPTVYYRFNNKIYLTHSNIPACDLPIGAVPSAVPFKRRHTCINSPKDKYLNNTCTYVMSTYLASSIQYKRVWVRLEKWVRRGYSSLSLRTKSLYICTYVVLKSYTFGLSGAGPGSFTWDPVPNERTSNPRLLQRRKRTRQ